MDLSSFIDAISATLYEQLVIPGMCLIGIFLILSIALFYLKERGNKSLKRIFSSRIKHDSSSVLPNYDNINNNYKQNVTNTGNKTADENQGICPLCGAILVTRTARKGPTAGQQFIGCSAFPNCRYTQNINKSPKF